MSLAKILLRMLSDTSILLVVILLIPGLPPHGDIEASFPVPPRPLEGPLDPKDYALNRAEKLFEGQMVGPECLEVSPSDPDVFYTSLQGGAIVKIYENSTKMKIVAKFGDEECAGNWDAKNCGRPLGLRFDKDGHLIASDSYLGIFKIDFESGETTNLVPKDDVVDGKNGKIFNSVAPAQDGKIYYTISSTNYPLNEGIGEMFGIHSGRLMVYDPVTKKSQVLVENIHFANGIVLSPDEDYVIFCECMQYRLHKYYIEGPKKGTSEVFLDGLPGSPDNLSLTPEGNIFVSLVTVRLPGQFNPAELMYNYPILSKLLLRVLHLMKLPLDLASSYLGYPITRQLASHILNLETLLPLMPPHSIILEVDWKGEILNSWHSDSRDFRFYSEAKIINGYMYLGSPFNDYLGRLKMPSSI